MEYRLLARWLRRLSLGRYRDETEGTAALECYGKLTASGVVKNTN